MTGAAEWRGRVGDVWAQEYARTERAFAGIAAVLDRVMSQHAPDRGRAADVGCGVGGTAVSLAAMRPDLRVTGIDLSPALLEVARVRAGSGGPTFVAGDAADVLPTIAPLDLLVSRHGVMFFTDPVAGFAALRRSVMPTAPLVFSCFRRRAENAWVTMAEAALGTSPTPAGGRYVPGPFAFGDPALLRDVLTAGGWTDVDVAPHCVDYVVGTGAAMVEEALAFYRRIGPAASVLAAADTAERDRLESRLRDLFATRIRSGAVTFTAAIWIVSARAGKELP